MSDILVITCPSGKQCSHLLPLLYNKGILKLRLAAHSQTSANKLKTRYPDAEIMSVDLVSLPDCRRLLQGATAVMAVLPSLHSREKEIGFNLVDAAVAECQRQRSAFKHFVLSSVLCTQHRSLLQHDLKSYVEERLFLSPLNWTILKPTNFMDAYPVSKLARQENPALDTRWNPEHENSVIALRDLAEASAKVLRERGAHYLAEYPLCSTMPISEAGIISVVEKRIGKSIEIRTPPSLDVAVSSLMHSLFGGETSEGDLRGDLVRDTLERLILFYNRRGLKGSPNTLRWLLGREPTTVEEWVELQLESTWVPEMALLV